MLNFKKELFPNFNKGGLERPYNSENSFAETYGEHKKFLEFSFEQFRELKQYCDEVGILMTASGWDEESVDFLYDLEFPFLKWRVLI